LFFEKSTVNGLTIFKRVLQFLYNEAYQGKKGGFFGGKNYDDFEKAMLENRPFELFVRFGRKAEKSYHRTEFKF